MPDERSYPTRPFLAVSAAIVHNGKVLIVRRDSGVARGLYTLPGGVVETGETLNQALIREVREETGLAIEPLAPAGYREMIATEGDGRVRRHFVILCFAARWLSGEPVPDTSEISEAKWRFPQELDALKTTDGLREIVETAMAQV